MPTTTVIKDPSGAKIQLPEDDPVPGKTTREDVEKQYKDVAVEIGVPDLFWGRFRRSTWKVAAGTYNQGAEKRMWGVRNILISFDADSVKSFETIDDDKFLLNRLRVLLKEQRVPSVDLTQPVRVLGWHSKQHSNFTLDLNDSEVVITEKPLPKSLKQPVPPARAATIPFAQIKKIELGREGSSGINEVDVSIHLIGKTGLGEQVAFKVAPVSAFVLARWMDQVKLEKK